MQVTDPTVGSKNPHHSMEIRGVPVKRKLEEGCRVSLPHEHMPLRRTIVSWGQFSRGGKEILVCPLSLRRGGDQLEFLVLKDASGQGLWWPLSSQEWGLCFYISPHTPMQLGLILARKKCLLWVQKLLFTSGLLGVTRIPEGSWGLRRENGWCYGQFCY